MTDRSIQDARTNAQTIGWLRHYFSSGWLPLVPYLAAYLAAAAAHAPVTGLLFVFRALHLLNILALCWCVWRRILTFDAPLLGAWALLGGALFVAGVYLEFPSDAWEHLGRIHAWESVPTVTDHPHWRKSSYFLAFSLSGHGANDHPGLEWYQTGMTLVWLWQAARLAVACGAGSGTAFLAAVLMLLTAGNSAFSFHRYYGLSSTLPSQIGVLAFYHVCLTVRSSSWRRDLLEGGSALAFIAFQHLQGIPIALLGAALILGGRWVGRSPAKAAAAAGLVLLLCFATYRWYPRSSVFAAIANPGGWLSPLHGLNLLHPSSPAATQALAIVGWLGIANIAAGILLLMRGHLVGWLTAGPVIALCLPVVAVPLTDYLLRFADLAVYHRLLFAIPAGLALALGGEILVRRICEEAALRRVAPVALAAAGLLLAVMPGSSPGFNRWWHVLAIAPDDVSLRELPTRIATVGVTGHTVVPPGLDFAFAVNRFPFLPDYALNWSSRLTISNEVLTPARRWQLATAALDADVAQSGSVWAFVPDPYSITTDFSLAARLSGHWLEQEVSLDHAGAPEFRRAALARGFRPSDLTQGSLLERGSGTINTRSR